MSHYLIFDIETRVDKELVKAVYDHEDALTVEQAYDTARDRLLEASSRRSDFFPIPFHVPIAVAMIQADEDYGIRSVACFGADRCSELDLLQRFWTTFEANRTLVTFNGRVFDLPVLELRSMKYGLSLPRYFAAGEDHPTYRGNRYSDAYHLDLCDFLGNFGVVHRRGSLDMLAKLVGLPGKYTIAGEDVEYLYREGRQKEINQYCTTDVLQTYFLFLRVELLRGKLAPAGYEAAIQAARGEISTLADAGGAVNFLRDFLERWKTGTAAASA
jgi:predicted PolB exonuclease-like 3'-5' exonuclease